MTDRQVGPASIRKYWDAYISEIFKEEVDIETTERNHYGDFGIGAGLSSHVVEPLR